MIEWNALREDPRIMTAAKLAGCALGACMLSLAEFGGMPVPVNSALAAALSPAGGIAVLCGSALTFALTGMLHTQPAQLCALALVTIIRWLFCIGDSPRKAALLAAGSSLLSSVIFALAGLTSTGEWILWLIGSTLAGGLAFCIRQVFTRFESGFPVRLHEGDALCFSVGYVVAVSALCALTLLRISFGELLAGFVILTAARRYRMTGGVLCGTLSALAMVLADGSTAGYAAVLPAAGFAAGYLAGHSGFLSYLVFQAFGTLSIMLSGWSTAAANSFVGGLIGGLAFLFLPAVPLADAVMQWFKQIGSRPRFKYLLTLEDPMSEFRNWWQMIPYLASKNDSFQSWPSGHMSIVGILFALPLLTDCMKKKSDRLNLIAFIFASAFVILCGYNRIHMTNHFLSDVSFGTLNTFLITSGICTVYMKVLEKKTS